jgi:hypothetical protein
MQHEKGKEAIEAHERCARFHILSYHMERDNPAFEKEMEDQQLMNSWCTFDLSKLTLMTACSTSKSQRVLRGPARDLHVSE